MHFLADESCDFAVVRAYELKGMRFLRFRKPVKCQGAEDQYVIELAMQEERVLLTEDKDFGRLVYLAGARRIGVVLLRFPPGARRELCDTVKKLVHQEGKKLKGFFVVVRPGRIRIRRLP